MSDDFQFKNFLIYLYVYCLYSKLLYILKHLFPHDNMLICKSPYQKLLTWFAN